MAVLKDARDARLQRANEATLEGGMEGREAAAVTGSVWNRASEEWEDEEVDEVSEVERFNLLDISLPSLQLRSSAIDSFEMVRWLI
jgi:hypothetical protein